MAMKRRISARRPSWVVRHCSGRRRAGDRPRYSFLFQQQSSAVRCSMLGQVGIEFLLAWCQVRKPRALGRSVLSGKMPVLLKSGNVRQDRLDCDAQAA